MAKINPSLAPFIRFYLQDLTLAPLGNSRFLAHIEAMTGIRRETRPRGRPRKEEADPQTVTEPDQGTLGI